MKKKNLVIFIGAILLLFMILYIGKISSNTTKKTSGEEEKNETECITAKIELSDIHNILYDTDVNYHNFYDNDIFGYYGYEIILSNGTKYSIPELTFSKKREFINNAIYGFISLNAPLDCWYGEFGYDYFINDNIISLVINFKDVGPIDPVLVVNFDKDTGNIISNADLLKYKNISNGKFIEVYNSKIKSLCIDISELCYDSYKIDKNIDNINIYLNENGNLASMLEVGIGGDNSLGQVENVVLFE